MTCSSILIQALFLVKEIKTNSGYPVLVRLCGGQGRLGLGTPAQKQQHHRDAAASPGNCYPGFFYCCLNQSEFAVQDLVSPHEAQTKYVLSYRASALS